MTTQYGIARTYLSYGDNNFSIGNFTIHNNSIILNIFDIANNNELLFIYILCTINTFNIVAENGIIYPVTNVTALPFTNTSIYIVFAGDIPVIPLVTGDTYIVSIPTNKSLTISNLVINGTIVQPLKSSELIMTSSNGLTNGPSISGPSQSGIITTPVQLLPPLTLSQYEAITANNINKLPVVPALSNINVIVRYQEPSQPIISNGLFSLTLNTIDYPNELPNKQIPSFFGSITSFFNNSFGKPQHQPHLLLPHIDVLNGTSYTMNASTLDAYNQPLNFIYQSSLLYLSNNTTSNTIAIKEIESSKNSENILEFNIILEEPLPITLNNTPYVLSTAPIATYVIYNYINNFTTTSVIPTGKFTILPISGTITTPTMILSTTDTISNMNIASFTSLLYTLIGTTNTLNILNVDYSIVCNLNILSVIPSYNQCIFTYAINSGANNLLNLNTTSNYIFTLLPSSDIVSIKNNTNSLQSYLLYNNKLLTTIQQIIQTESQSIFSMDMNESLNLINSAVTLSTLIVNIPFNQSTLVTNNATMISGQNALDMALEAAPNNTDLQVISPIINNVSSPIIVAAALKNAKINIDYVSTNIKHLSDNSSLLNTQQGIDNILEQMATTSPYININIPNINSLLSNINNSINAAFDQIPNNPSIYRAKIIINALNTYFIPSINNYNNILYPATGLKTPSLKFNTSESKPFSLYDKYPIRGPHIFGTLLFIGFVLFILFIINKIQNSSDSLSESEIPLSSSPSPK